MEDDLTLVYDIPNLTWLSKADVKLQEIYFVSTTFYVMVIGFIAIDRDQNLLGIHLHLLTPTSLWQHVSSRAIDVTMYRSLLRTVSSTFLGGF